MRSHTWALEMWLKTVDTQVFLSQTAVSEFGRDLWPDFLQQSRRPWTKGKSRLKDLVMWEKGQWGWPAQPRTCNDGGSANREGKLPAEVSLLSFIYITRFGCYSTLTVRSFVLSILSLPYSFLLFFFPILHLNRFFYKLNFTFDHLVYFKLQLMF